MDQEYVRTLGAFVVCKDRRLRLRDPVKHQIHVAVPSAKGSSSFMAVIDHVFAGSEVLFYLFGKDVLFGTGF